MEHLTRTAANVNTCATNTCEASVYLDLLAPGTQSHLFLGVLPKDQERAGRKGSVVLFGAFSDLEDKLRSLNDAGYNIFVTLGEANGTRRRNRHMVKPRAVVIDADEGLPETLPLTPTMVVETSPGKAQAVYAVDGLTWEQYEGIQRRLIADHGCDKAVKDRARIVRLPGFSNTKYADRPSATLASVGERYEPEAVLAAFPPIEKVMPTFERGELAGAGAMLAKDMTKLLDTISKGFIASGGVKLMAIDRTGGAFEVSLAELHPWFCITAACRDAQGTPEQLEAMWDAFDRLSRLAGGDAKVQALLKKVYRRGRNREIFESVDLPAEYEAATGQMARTYRTIKAIHRGACRILKRTHKLHAFQGKSAKIIAAYGLNLTELHRMAQDRIFITTHRGKAREVAMAYNDMIQETGARIELTVEVRKAICDRAGVTNDYLSKMNYRFKEAGLFDMIPGRHGQDGTAFIFWTREIIDQVSMQQAVEEKAAAGVEQSVQSLHEVKERGGAASWMDLPLSFGSPGLMDRIVSQAGSVFKIPSTKDDEQNAASRHTAQRSGADAVGSPLAPEIDREEVWRIKTLADRLTAHDTSLVYEAAELDLVPEVVRGALWMGSEADDGTIKHRHFLAIGSELFWATFRQPEATIERVMGEAYANTLAILEREGIEDHETQLVLRAYRDGLARAAYANGIMGSEGAIRIERAEKFKARRQAEAGANC